MKKSAAIQLLLLGTVAALAGCAPDEDNNVQETRQNSYTSQEDCRKDWGQDARDCQQNGTGGHAGYVGPRYMYNHGGGFPVILDRDGTSRPAPNSYLARPGAVSTAHSTTTTRSFVSSGGAGRSVSRGGFGGFGHGGFSSGG